MDEPIYRHYKGGLYQIICIGVHTETGESLVTYRNYLVKSKAWIRPVDMFFGKVELSDGTTVDRFTVVP